MKLLKKISNFGIKENTSPLQKRKIKFTNQVSIAIGLVLTFLFVLMLMNRFYISAIITIVFIVVYFLLPLLNKKKHVTFTSIIISIFIPVIIVMASIMSKINVEKNIDISFFIIPKLIILASFVIPLLLIDYSKKISFYLTLFVYFVAFVLFDIIHELVGIKLSNVNYSSLSSINIALASFFAIVIITVSFISMQKLNTKYENEIVDSNLQYKEKNEELLATEEELRQNNEELSVLKENLEEKEERLHYILNNQGNGFGLIDINGIFTFVNQAATDIFEISKDELIGKNISDFIVDKELKAMLNVSGKCQNNTKIELEIELNTVNKKKFIRTIVSYDCDKNQNIIGLNGVFRDVSKLKEEQEKIRLLNIKLSKYFVALEHAPTTIVITDTTGLIEYVNPYFTTMTGYTYDEAIGKNPRILKTKHTPPEVFVDLWETISSGKVWEGELYNHKKNRDIFIERAVIAPVKNDGGEIISYIAIKEDITEIKKAQEELAQKINQQQILINHLPANIFLKDNQLKYLAVNKKYAESLNLTQEQMKGKKFTDFFPDETFVEDTDINIIKNKQALINLEIQKKGKWLSISKVPYFDEKGEVSGIIGIIQDITNQKLEEQKIKELNQELKKYFVAIEQNSMGIAFVDENGIRQYVNSKYLEITGYTIAQAVGQKTSLFDDENIELIQEVKQGKTIKREYYRKAKNYFFQRLVVSPILNDDKEAVMFVILIEDISIEKQQQRIIQEQHTKLEIALKNIHDSLNYAKVIQESLLPKGDLLNKYFPENFVFFIAKDVVSGDFYYFKKYKDYIILSVADCTGHGIPGAFISMLGYSLLNQIITYDNVDSPGMALELLRKQTKQIFENFHGGMDIALCAINTKTNKLQFAGAYNPLYIVRNKELIVFKATPNPIGYYPVEKEFVTKTTALEENDVLYLFSDGYADQFGEDENGKNGKYTKKRFKNLLVNISDKKFSEQKKMLENNFDLWRDGQEQIDDVAIVGLKWNSENVK